VIFSFMGTAVAFLAFAYLNGGKAHIQTTWITVVSRCIYWGLAEGAETIAFWC